MRPSGRKIDEMRAVSIETGVTMHAEGSCLIKMGNTHVLCTASVDEKVPPFLRNTGLGWVTAEYGMLPRATHTRMRREAKNGQCSKHVLALPRAVHEHDPPDVSVEFGSRINRTHEDAREYD